jgi:type II secretory pathway pseudopilin PulG
MRSSQPIRYPEVGFTLIELAVVLMIVGLIVGGLLNAWATQLVQQRINTTKANAETIKTALTNYVSRNNRLPCPAIAGLLPSAAAYGQEAATPGTCTGSAGIGVPPNDAARGIVPWIALGLTSESASDAYNNRFTYQVSKGATNLNATTLASMQGVLTLHSDAPIALGVAPTGNQINGCNATAGNNSCNGFAVVVILSHGKNGTGATAEDGTLLAAPTSAREIQNAGNNNAFVRSDYSTVDANYFDDILLALSPDDLLGPLVKDGAISSARAQTQKQMELSRDALIAQSVSSGILPPPPLAVGNDGWGKASILFV